MQQPRLPPIFTLLLLCMTFPTSLHAQTATAGVELFVPPQTYYYLSYSASTNNFLDIQNLVLHTPSIASLRDGCTTPLTPPSTGGWISVLERGGTCNFADKVKAAQDAGASAVIIVNTPKAIYNFTGDGHLLSPCWLQCNMAQAQTMEQCQQLLNPTTCAMGCASTTTYNNTVGSFCCLNSGGLLDMSLGDFEATIPSVFASMQDGQEIIAAAVTGNTQASLSLRPIAVVDGSVILLGLLGVSVLIGATFRAASMERNRSSWTWKHTDGHFLLDQEMVTATEEHFHPDNALEQIEISLVLVIGFLCVATTSIIVLFFLVQWYPVQVVIALQVVFALGTMGSFSFVFAQPIVRRMLGMQQATRMYRVKLPAFLRACAGLTEVEIIMQDAIGIVFGGAVSWTWFICRHESWAWILLNILAASLVCSFLLVIRLPSYKLAVALLCAFFLYDIFMVFLTPLLFQGKSVMVEVATAGRGGETVSKDGQVCERTETESVPMLFLIPHFNGWPGGYSMLGLGDVILPGLLVVLVLRFDYARTRRIVGASRLPTSVWKAHVHWIAVCLAYAFGIFMTFLANISGWTLNGVRGQPALMYLVPCCLLTVLGTTLWTGEFMALWRSDWTRWEKGDYVDNRTASSDAAAAATAPASTHRIMPSQQSGEDSATSVGEQLDGTGVVVRRNTSNNGTVALGG